MMTGDFFICGLCKMNVVYIVVLSVSKISDE